MHTGTVLPHIPLQNSHRWHTPADSIVHADNTGVLLA